MVTERLEFAVGCLQVNPLRLHQLVSQELTGSQKEAAGKI